MNHENIPAKPVLRLVSPHPRTPREPGITLVLGSGGSRGLAHIGVLQALEELQIPVRAIVGCSVGAQLGALYASGWTVRALVQHAHSVTRTTILRVFFPWSLRAGLLHDAGVTALLRQHLGTRNIEDLSVPFVAVATDIQTGRQILLDQGPAWSAVRASISMPGIYPPFRRSGRGPFLVDGAISDPVPVSVARTRYPWPVVAVQVQLDPAQRTSDLNRYFRPMGWFQVARSAHEITLWQLSQARLQQVPPDLCLQPVHQDLGCFSYRRSTVLIQSGYDSVMSNAQALRKLSAATEHNDNVPGE